MITPRTLSGFKDRLPGECIAKHDIIAKLTATFRSFGFSPIETPHLEYADILVKQGSEEIQKELYRFKDHGERDVALRFDLTVPLARFVSQHKDALGIPFKRYAIGNVFRGERAQAGRYREFTQCDFDFIGTRSVSSDAEIVLVIFNALKGIGIDNFTIKINNRKIMNGLCEHFGVSDKVGMILREVDKIEKVGKERVEIELEKLGLSSEVIVEILEFVEQKGSDRLFFDGIQKYKMLNESTKKGVEELEEFFGILESLAETKGVCVADFSIARGLGYYTGIVYETTLNELTGIGSVASGGRYDNLTQNFSTQKLPGVGASIGLDRLLAALEQLGTLKKVETPATLLVLNMDENLQKEALQIAYKIRCAGVNTEFYPEPQELKKQLKYADKKGHTFVLFFGEEEFKNDCVTIKNMQDGTQMNKVSLFDAIMQMKNTRAEAQNEKICC